MSPRFFAGVTLLALAGGVPSAALAQAQTPASSTVTDGTSPAQATPAASPATPASSAVAASVQPAAAADPSAAAPRQRREAARATAAPTTTATPGPAGSDRIELGTTEISGNRELPKLMYIVPWKRAEVGKITGRPPNSLVDEVLTPVDRTVFERQNSYYAALQAASASDASQPAAPGAQPAAAAPRDEK